MSVFLEDDYRLVKTIFYILNYLLYGYPPLPKEIKIFKSMVQKACILCYDKYTVNICVCKIVWNIKMIWKDKCVFDVLYTK